MKSVAEVCVVKMGVLGGAFCGPKKGKENRAHLCTGFVWYMCWCFALHCCVSCSVCCRLCCRLCCNAYCSVCCNVCCCVCCNVCCCVFWKARLHTWLTLYLPLMSQHHVSVSVAERVAECVAECVAVCVGVYVAVCVVACVAICVEKLICKPDWPYICQQCPSTALPWGMWARLQKPPMF